MYIFFIKEKKGKLPTKSQRSQKQGYHPFLGHDPPVEKHCSKTKSDNLIVEHFQNLSECTEH